MSFASATPRIEPWVTCSLDLRRPITRLSPSSAFMLRAALGRAGRSYLRSHRASFPLKPIYHLRMAHTLAQERFLADKTVPLCGMQIGDAFTQLR